MRQLIAAIKQIIR